jgi:hypothetical protein
VFSFNTCNAKILDVMHLVLMSRLKFNPAPKDSMMTGIISRCRFQVSLA